MSCWLGETYIGRQKKKVNPLEAYIMRRIPGCGAFASRELGLEATGRTPAADAGCFKSQGKGFRMLSAAVDDTNPAGS